MDEPVNILLVEDEEAHAALIHRAFEDGPSRVVLKVVDRLAAAFAEIKDFKPDLIITDWRLPDGEGLQILADREVAENHPVVVMTSQGSEALAVEAMKAGALDYVTKNTALAEMPLIAERALRRWRDLVEKKKTEAALKESEDKFSKAFQRSPVWVVISTLAEGRYIEVNDTFLRGTGFERDEVIGRTSGEIGTWADPADRAELVRIIKEKGALQNYEVRRKNKEGRELTMLVSAERMEFKGEECLVFVSLDITERKELEASLQQAHKMEAVGTLAGGVAHDFNNILQSISAYIQLLSLSSEQPGQPGRYIREIEKSVRRAAELVEQLLTLSRKVESRKKPIDLNAEVENVTKLLARTMPKSIETIIDLDPGLKPVKANATQIEQILFNLTSNAQDAMPDGGVLEIKTRPADSNDEPLLQNAEVEPGRYVRLSVRDTGQGMDQSTLKHIFEPFFTTKEIGQGTGLGLATVYGIVKEHGGHIHVESRTGGGSVFDVFLPAASEPKEPRPEPPAARPAPGGNETILIVDDEPQILESTRDFLEHFGYTILTAASGEEALRIFSAQGSEIDLAILDLNMPGLSGRQTLKALVELDPEVKALIASGYSRDIQGREVQESGAVGFIPKPYLFKDMLETIRTALDS